MTDIRYPLTAGAKNAEQGRNIKVDSLKWVAVDALPATGEAGQVYVLSSNGSAFQWWAGAWRLFGGGGGSGSSAEEFNQVSHTFEIGDPVRYTGSAWIVAQCDTVVNAEAAGIVSAVNGNRFTVTYTGPISDIPITLTPGEVYFLSDTGGLTISEPTTAGYVSKPMLLALSPSSGIVLSHRGMVIPEAIAEPAGQIVNAATGSQVIDMLPITSYRTIRWVVQLQKASTVLILEIVGSHDGSTGVSDVRPTSMLIGNGATDVSLAVDIVSNNIRLTANPATSGWTITWRRLYALGV